MPGTSAKEMEAVARRWIEEGWRQGRPEVVDELHDPAFVDHDSAGRPGDNEGFKSGIERLYAAFPDLEAAVEDLVIDEGAGKVAVRWSASGRQQGSYLGLEPTGKRIRFKGIEIITIRDGRIVERWGEWDGIDLLAQMGGFP